VAVVGGGIWTSISRPHAAPQGPEGHNAGPSLTGPLPPAPTIQQVLDPVRCLGHTGAEGLPSARASIRACRGAQGGGLVSLALPVALPVLLPVVVLLAFSLVLLLLQEQGLQPVVVLLQ